jgi:NAD(P)-dependent dehydrogenase (short-subunit alcohol dehydrogenase family)
MAPMLEGRTVVIYGAGGAIGGAVDSAFAGQRRV